MDTITHFLFRRRTAFLPLAALVMLILGHPTTKGFLAGLVFVVIGQWIRFWSAGYLVKSSELTMDGPYRCVRNPLYVGSLLIACGYCFMTSGWIVWVIGMPFFFAIHGSAVRWEERFLLKTYGDSFADYCRRVPRWIMHLPAKGLGTGEKWALSQVAKNKENTRCIPTIVVTTAFILKMVFHWYPK